MTVLQKATVQFLSQSSVEKALISLVFAFPMVQVQKHTEEYA